MNRAVFAVLVAILTAPFAHSRRVVKPWLNVSEFELRRRLVGRDLRPKATAALEHKVADLPGLRGKDTIVHYAGLLPATADESGMLFYWLFKRPISRGKEHKKRLVIWMNGGPGCSSMDGLFLEHGPFKLDGQLSLQPNPHSWHHLADIVYIDQPVGTGLSFTTDRDGYPKNDHQVNKQLFHFVQEFLKLHTDYVMDGKSCDIYLAGESHAGHYIPAFALHALRNSKEPKPGDVRLTIAGLAIGNGWISPDVQYDVSDFAYSLGVISFEQRETLKTSERKCQAALARGDYSPAVCFGLLDSVIAASTSKGYRMNMYDVREYLQHSEAYPPGHQLVEKFMNQPAVKAALHASHVTQRFVECADPPYHALKHQDGKGVTTELALLLDAGVRVLLFAGQYDLIVNQIGTAKILRALDWKGKDGFGSAVNGVFMMKKTPAGYIKEYENLASVVVAGAGHMVPMDKPAESFELLRRFLDGLPLSDGIQRIKASHITRAGQITCVGQQPLASALPPVNFVGEPLPLDGGATFQIEAPQQGVRLELSTISAHGSESSIHTVKNATDVYSVSGLVNGETYHLSATVIDTGGMRTQSKQSAPFVPGCVMAASSLQCCGHGLCGRGLSSSSAQCFCHADYSGEFCERRKSDDAYQCDAGANQLQQRSGSLDSAAVVLADECGTNNQGGLCEVAVTMRLRSPLLASNWEGYAAASEAMLVSDIRSILSTSSMVSLHDVQHMQARLWKNVTNEYNANTIPAVAAQVTFKANSYATTSIGQELSRHFQSAQALLNNGVITSWIDPYHAMQVTVRPAQTNFVPAHDTWQVNAASSLNGIMLLASPVVLFYLFWQFRRLRHRSLLLRV